MISVVLILKPHPTEECLVMEGRPLQTQTEERLEMPFIERDLL
ncbi:MAG: hypothetical protein ACYC9S_08470 [Leptospirales bacterium]